MPRNPSDKPSRPTEDQSASEPRDSHADARRAEGEGSSSAARDYQRRIDRYMDRADVEADAQAAAPRSADEAAEMQDAEREGRAHSRATRGEV